MSSEKTDIDLDQLARRLAGMPITRRKFMVMSGGAALGAASLPLLLEACQAGSQALTRGGTLIYAMETADIPSLDPHTALGSGNAVFQAIIPMFEGLVMVDGTHTDRAPVVPVLAKSWTAVDGGKTWEWKLRENVTFHDGSPWNADAAIFNFKRLYDKTSPQYFAVAASYAQANATPGPIVGLDKIDDLTFRIRLTEARPLDEELVSLWMVSPKAVTAQGNEGFGLNPVGTGGMKFGSLTKGQQFDMVPYSKYWGAAYKLDKIIVRPIADDTARVSALLAGEVDLAVWIPSDSVDPLKKAGKQVVLNSPPLTWEYFFNLRLPPYNDKRVRQALNYAIDRVSLSKDILKGTATPMDQLFTKGSTWYDESLQPYTFNPTKAKALLADAGYPNGFKTEWWTATNGTGELSPVPMSEFIQANLKAIGVDLTLKTFEWTAYLGEFFKGMQPNVGAYQISLGWTTTNWWGLLFGEKYLPPNGPLNPGYYDNPKVDPLYMQAMTLPTAADRVPLIKQIQAMVWDDAPWLFVVHGDFIRSMAPRVHGFINTYAYTFSFQPIYVS